jgi:hypothetical protein
MGSSTIVRYFASQEFRVTPGSDETIDGSEPQNKKVQQKCNSSKYLSAFLQAIRHPITPSWLVQPALCTYQNLIKTSGCTSQDGVDWRERVKIFVDVKQ